MSQGHETWEVLTGGMVSNHLCV